MLDWFKQLDQILRGDGARLQDLRENKWEIQSLQLIFVILLLAVVYGFCVGSYSLIQSGGANYWQIIASSIKMPLLFALTLFVTFPSLYVFSALVGSRLSIHSIFNSYSLRWEFFLPFSPHWGQLFFSSHSAHQVILSWFC